MPDESQNTQPAPTPAAQPAPVTPTGSSMDFMGLKGQLEGFLNTYLHDKAPALPKELKDFIVQYGPIISGVLIVLGLLAVIPLLGLIGGAATLLGYYGYSLGPLFYIGLLFSIGALVLEGLAIPGLMKRSKKMGWDLLFYSIWVSAAASLLQGSWVALIVSTVVGLYVLFQVREYYS